MNKAAALLFSRFLLLTLATALLGWTLPANAKDRAALEADAKKAYANLIAKVPAAKAASTSAVAVLVFPKITKAGLGVQGNKIARLDD